MFNYAIKVHKEKDHYWSECRDIPEAHSAGDTLDELLVNALEGIQLALGIYQNQYKEIPLASPPVEDEQIIYLPVLTVAKIHLWNAMRKKGMKKADLTRLLNSAQSKTERLLNFSHNSKIEHIEHALNLLDERFDLEIAPSFA